MLSCLLSSVTTYVWEKPKEWVSSPGSSPRLSHICPIFPLGISISVFWLPLTQTCKTRLSPRTVCSCYWHYCSPRHKPLRPSITFIPTLFSLSFQSAASPVDSSLRSLSVSSVSIFIQALISHLHCYIGTYQVCFVLNHCIILSFHCQAPLMAPIAHRVKSKLLKFFDSQGSLQSLSPYLSDSSSHHSPAETSGQVSLPHWLLTSANGCISSGPNLPSLPGSRPKPIPSRGFS